MKFIVSSPLLSKNLQSINGVINSSNRLPILDNFLFSLEENTLEISGTDLETTIKVNIPVIMAEGNGTICINPKILLGLLKTFSDIPITFTINEESLGIELSAGDGNYKLNGYSSSEFPKLPVIENATTLNIQSDVLAKAINKSLFAASSDDLRPVMTGVFFQLTPENITFVATDAHKLIRYKRTDAHSEKTASFISPKKPLNLLKNVLSSIEEANVTVAFNNSNASFIFSNFTIICRLIEGKYPNWEAVIPLDNPNKLTLDKHLFLNSLKRVSIFSNQATFQVKLKISGREMIISAEDYDYANEAKERLACQYEGDDIEIGFNSRFLIEMLNNIDSNNVIFEMSHPSRAALILPLENDNKDEDLLMLVMPVQLNQGS